MKEIYKKIWELAKEYYMKGRKMDIEHIEWMMGDAVKVCEKENIDESLLLPLVILHDVGYAEVPKGNPYNLDLRRAHMKAGAKIAKDILIKLNYPKDKINKIVYYVSVHDNWAFGDFKLFEDKFLGVFNDLDFIWMATPKGFPNMMKLLNKTPKEVFDFIKDNERKTKPKFATVFTKKLYQTYMKQREEEL
jgi:hypothetical protein